MLNQIDCFKKGLKDGVPIATGYLAVSFTLGIAAKKVGMNTFQATLMSFLNLTSAGEFAAIGLIGTGASYLEMAITQFIINIRYFLMSCALSQKLEKNLPFFHRFFLAFGITDEIFGLSVSVSGKLNPYYTYGMMTLAIPGWALGTCLGVITGNALSPRILSAFSVALYGMFLAVIVPPMRKNKILAGIVIISMFMSGLFSKLPIIKNMSSGFQIIILTILIAGIAAILFPIQEDKTLK
ncbi:MAG: AzlC family ABC transporter permease [Lachnospiraceae bacterium]|jgi:predicted branched-subunit amino acid permease|nr:AzlC family ABC transporter permease [Lachnospiraceae bacterium]